jgi:hypothetical protein
MRPVHFLKPSAGHYVEPLCGVWGLMDTHWTEVADAVTCGACQEALRNPPSGAWRVGLPSAGRSTP